LSHCGNDDSKILTLKDFQGPFTSNSETFKDFRGPEKMDTISHGLSKNYGHPEHNNARYASVNRDAILQKILKLNPACVASYSTNSAQIH